MSMKLEELKKIFIEKSGYNEDHITNEIERAVKFAIKDFTFRTEKKRRKEKFGVDEMLALLKGKKFVKHFENYFIDEPIKTQKEFDKWHNQTCEIFLDNLEDVYDSISYGKAQKVVNMTFKYAYCLDVISNIKEEDKEKYFIYCHMPLDSYTLEWFKRKIVKAKKIRVCSKNNVKYIPTWSNIEYSVTEEDKGYSYMVIQDAIRKYFDKSINDEIPGCFLKKDKSALTPLQAEFYIWPYIQLEEAVESLYKQMANLDINIDKNIVKIFKSKGIDEKIDLLKEYFSDIEKYKLT